MLVLLGSVDLDLGFVFFDGLGPDDGDDFPSESFGACVRGPRVNHLVVLWGGYWGTWGTGWERGGELGAPLSVRALWRLTAEVNLISIHGVYLLLGSLPKWELSTVLHLVMKKLTKVVWEEAVAKFCM
jgi:hypothetical protein